MPGMHPEQSPSPSPPADPWNGQNLPESSPDGPRVIPVPYRVPDQNAPQQPANITFSPQTNVNVTVGGQSQPARPGLNKSVGVAYALWAVLGLVGGHHFYLGKIGRGVAYLFTGGLFIIGWVVDAFTLPRQVRMVNARGY